MTYIVTIPGQEPFRTDYDPSGRFGVEATWVELDNSLETEWLIDIGPFFDRFGSAKMDVLSSTNATVKAIIEDVRVRKWIDLKRPDVTMAMDVIGAIIPSVTAGLREAILTTPVTAEENLALRKLYFS